ncbi:S8 family serine peptidase [Solirubrobacter sp. CPCC 204708]|uniref:S8 family serine peptidase n=1 Tax=Solirubrobacter deserti TaxID=2282478 RepID=A0ABT4RN93_9ACTN|nr:S8 family peptidase [Solirubrobacter deserti]MBE2317458.1 S8 family serine peptidase [Solirubrobacter deserti]MDA0140040.1 S8 family serine peptidase [Solirubrobacter deserti]
MPKDLLMRFPLALLALLLAAPATAHAAEGDIIVTREPGTTAAEVRQDADVALVKPLGIEHTELVEPRDGDVAGALAELRADEDVVFAEPDSVVSISALVAPDDLLFSALWGLRNIFAVDVWARTEGADVRVGVVDTGVDGTHEDLAGQVVGGYDFVSRDAVAQDGHGHGTHVAGTIAARGRNGLGVIGVAPAAKIVPLRALGNDGNGYMSDIAAAFDYAGDQGLKIVNASLGGGYARVLETVIGSHPNTLYVVAAGNAGQDNDNRTTASYPCALPQANIVCVAANDSRDRIASFSNYGAQTVDIAAPGVGVRSTVPGNRYESMNGTSMASPHVAGAAALALAANPSATAAQLKWALLGSVDAAPSFTGKSLTAGRLNAPAAVAAITGTLPTAPATVAPVAPPAEPAPSEAVPTPEAPVSPAPETPVAPADPAPAAPAPPASPGADAPPVTMAPRLSGLAVAGTLKRASGRLRVSFQLNLPATVRFTVTAKGKRVATWTRKGQGGGNHFTLTRRLPTGKTLKRGSYKLAVSLSATAQASASLRVR